MARRAKFGQTPRVQPSLTSTLVAIANEMVAREDSNIMDAWQHGGEYEGKKVTDQMVLQYWKDREQGLDKSDPTYDTMQNQIEQLQYGIQQSEMDLKHLQGKISDSQFAQFYLNWAKKAPRNSEWWRSLQKDAAQLMEAAKNKSRASADSAKAKAFNDFQSGEYDKHIAIGNELSAAMQKMSQETGLSITDHGEELLALVTADYAAHPDEYHALRQALKTADPSFGGQFTMQYFTNAMNSATQGYDRIAERAHSDGYATAFASASKSQADMSWFATNTKAWPVATAYDKAYTTAMKTVNDPTSSEMDKRAAWAAFANTAYALAKTPGLDTDVIAMLTADGDRAMGKDVTGDTKSFGPSMLGPSHPGVTPDQGAAIAAENEREANMAAHPDQFAYAPVDKNGNYDPTGSGPIGIVDHNQVPNDAILVPVPSLDGTAHMVAFKPQTVYMEDPSNPSTSTSENGVPVGRSISYQVGGQTVTLYETGGSDGKAHWSTSSPFNSDLKQNTAPDGSIHLTTGAPPLSNAQRAQAVYTQAQELDAKHGTHIADTIIHRDPQTGQIDGFSVSQATSFGKTGSAEQGAAGGTTITFDSTKGFSVKTNNAQYAGGNLTAGGSSTVDYPLAGQSSDPTALRTAALDPSRFAAGNIPGTTFDTPMGAAASAFDKTLTTAQLKTLVNDPAFEHAWLVQANSTLGITNPLMDTRGYDEWSKFKADVLSRPDTTVAQAMSPYFNTRTPDQAVNAAQRADLAYPGAPAGGPTASKTPDITFAGQTLRIPANPAMRAEEALMRGEGQTSAQIASWRDQILHPGQQPGTPATTPTPTAPTFKTTTTTPTTPPTTSPTPTAPPPGTTPSTTPSTSPGTRQQQLQRLL